jgi:hypothetical protein
MSEEVKPQLTEEEIELLEDVLNNRKNVPYQDARTSILDVAKDIKEQLQTGVEEAEFNDDKFAEFWKVFGWVPNMVWNNIVYKSILKPAQEAITDVGQAQIDDPAPDRQREQGMSYVKWTNMISYSLGRRYEDLEPEVREGLDLIYNTVDPSSLDEISSLAGQHHDAFIDAILAGKDPRDIVITVDDANMEILAEYSSEADLSYKAYLEKEAKENGYRDTVLTLTDEAFMTGQRAQLEEGIITPQQYLDNIDKRLRDLDIDIEAYLTAQDAGELGPGMMGPAQMPFNEVIDDPFLQVSAFNLGSSNYYGLGDVDLKGPVYSNTDEIPLYEYGLGRQLFANASAEEIMEVQLLLVEAGFLKPFSFVYGVLDNNDGGTVQAIESAMSRFNINGEAVTREDLLSIMSLPGASPQNLTVFIKEFYKDTLEDYAFGTDNFETSDSYGVNYNSVFTYIKPNFYNAKGTIENAIQKGLGRPASQDEIDAYVSFINRTSYDLQKKNYDINNANIQKTLDAERTRAQLAGSGIDYNPEVTLEQPLSGEALASAVGNEFDKFIQDRYGDMLQGQRASALYNDTYANVLTNIANLGNYIKGR